jgi:hypothetical protein
MPNTTKGEDKMIEDCEHRYSVKDDGTFVCELCERVLGVHTKNDDFNVLAFCAFRYALGRKTYIVDSIIKALIANKHRIPHDRRQRICSEIEHAISKDEAGMDCDVEDWKRLVKELQCTK